MNLIRIQQFLQEECHLLPGSLLAVAVSGGADSVCLAHLLSRLEYKILVIHFNHHIRPESRSDADFVQEFCELHQLPLVAGEGNVPSFAAEHHLSIEEAARQLRYQFLFSSARQLNARAVLTAHHAGDQAETILMHLIRGSGSAGLRGIQKRAILPVYDLKIPLIRPLIETGKDEILTYCQENQLDFIHDKSNDDESYFRNWLRHSLLPQIETKNPKFKSTLNRTAQILTDELEWMQSTLDEEWQSALSGAGEGYLQFEYAKVSKYIPGLFRCFARRAIQSLRPVLRDIDFEDIERFYQFVLRPPGTARIDLVSGLDLVIEEGILTICNHGTEIPVTDLPQIDHEFEIEVPGVTQIGLFYVLKTELIDIGKLDSRYLNNTNRMEAWLDLDQIEGKLQLRTVKPGDRIALLGHEGHSSKVSDVFVNHKLRRSARAHYPLICCKNQILWIPGILIADSVKISVTTERVLHLCLER